MGLTGKAVENEIKIGQTLILQNASTTWRTAFIKKDDDFYYLDMGSLILNDLESLERGTVLECRYHLSRAMCEFEATFAGFEEIGGLKMIKITVPVNVTEVQRRSHIRLTTRMNVHLRLPLLNIALSRSRGKKMVFGCWVEGVAVNLGAGGFRAELKLPRGHEVYGHKRALINFGLAGRFFEERELGWIRQETNTDEVVHVYEFKDLTQEDMDYIENHNSRWTSTSSVLDEITEK
jgi:hypothetical protein